MTLREESRGNWGKILFQRNSTTNPTRTDLESTSDLRDYRLILGQGLCNIDCPFTKENLPEYPNRLNEQKLPRNSSIVYL